MKLGILTGGGDCPGLNPVIRAAVKTALQEGFEVFGIHNGWKGLVEADIKPLDASSVSGILHRGGTILGTSRTNPFKDKGALEKLKANFKKFGLDALIAIGGEDTLGVANKLYQEGLKIVGVPKTIDNDLILPNHYPSFGFETARYVGTKIVDTLMVDAKTTKRWFLVTSMGRKAGFLALGLGIASRIALAR